jgi:predicted nucleic acid-binding protein
LIVIDASAVVVMLLGLERADVVMDRVFSGNENLHAPELLDVEVAQVVRKYWRAGDITPSRGEQAIADLRDLPIRRHSHEPLLGRIWQLRHNATAYDATYLALAEGLRAGFLTLDSGLARVPGVRLHVEVL